MEKRHSISFAFVLSRLAPRLLTATSIALLGLSAGPPALAQGSGVLTGTIVDTATNKPLADAVVTVTSPALQGEQIVVTDASGAYRIPNLPPGDYTLRVDRYDYHPYAREGIVMRLNSTLRANVELLPETVSLEAEQIEIVGKAPTVDIGSSSTGVTVDSDFTSRVPVPTGASRSFENLAVMAPGAQGDTYGVSINGTTSPENAFQIDGVTVNNPAFGTLGTPLSSEFIKELSVITGGYMPEYGRSMGGVMDAVTRTGSNNFHGTVFFDVTPGSLEGSRKIVRRNGTVIDTQSSLESSRTFGASLGGPILKDKLWFFVGAQAAFTRYRLDRSLNELLPSDTPTPEAPWKTDENGFILTRPIPGTSHTYYADTRAFQYIGKLTYLFNPDHTLTASVYGTPSFAGGNGTFASSGGNLAGTFDALAGRLASTSSDLSLKYAGAFDNKKTLIDVTFGWHHQGAANLPSDGSEVGSRTGLAGIPAATYQRSRPDRHSIDEFEPVPPGYCRPLPVAPPTETMRTVKVLTRCPVNTYSVGGPGFIDQSRFDSYQLRGIYTGLFTLAGHHVVKAGLDVNLVLADHTKAYSGTVALTESADGKFFSDARQFGFLSGPDQPVILERYRATNASVLAGAFVQDSWQILDKVTLNVGLRYDAQMLFGSDGRLGLSLPHQWSPRVGVIWDPTEQGRAKLFANYARFYEGVPLDMAERSFPGEPQIRSRHFARTDATPGGCDPRQDPKSPACLTERAPGSSRSHTKSNPNRVWSTTGGNAIPVDPEIAPQSSDQVVFGGELEVIPDGRLGVTYTHSYLNRAIEDMSRDEGTTYFIGNPGFAMARDFPKAVRNYDAGTIFFQKAFSDGWLAQASYTLSYLRGNYAGLFRPETGQLDPNVNSDFDLRSLLENRTGVLPADRKHQIKLYGAKDFALPGGMGLQLGLTYRARSGSPLNVLGWHQAYAAYEVFILPRGAGGRNDWIHTIDGRIGYGIRLSRQSRMVLSLDVFNLFNFQGVAGRDQHYSPVEVRPIGNGSQADLAGKLVRADGTPFDPATDKNPNYLNPTGYQAPRQFRLSARVSF